MIGEVGSVAIVVSAVLCYGPVLHRRLMRGWVEELGTLRVRGDDGDFVGVIEG